MSEFSAIGGTAIGNMTVMISQDRQHSIADLAMNTAKQIINIDNITDERQVDAINVQLSVALILRTHFVNCISDEKARLTDKATHCDTGYNVLTHVEAALSDILEIRPNPWSSLIRSAEWHDAAMISIGNMMATALHVERLWFAEDHLDNQSAINYKLRFNGK